MTINEVMERKRKEQAAKVPVWLREAMNVALRRVRLERAHVHLQDGYVARGWVDGDTKAIREATKVFFDSWLEPILTAVRDGDHRFLKEFLQNERATDPDVDKVVPCYDGGR